MTVFESLLNNTVYLYRRHRSPDGQGGWEISYTVNGSTGGRIRPATSAEKTVAQQEERKITHVLYVIHGIDIVRGDQALIQDLLVDIEAIREPSKADEHLEIDCLERQQESSDMAVSHLLLEDGSHRLLEDGGHRLLE